MLFSRVLGFFSVVACLAACPGTGTGDKDGGSKRDGFNLSTDGPTFIDMARNTTSCVGGGMPCSSVNPGTCDKGTVTCDGPLAMCTPDSMLQDCYDGIAGTAGIGVCTSGKQSCIGILGECVGQILPAMQENCLNDLDDDCDGKVNNGCPDTIYTGTPRVLTKSGMTTNANKVAVDARCPQDAFVIGADTGWYDPQFSVTKIKLTCAKATLIRPSSGTIYQINLVPQTPAPFVTYQSSGALETGTQTDGACSTSTSALRALIHAEGKWDAGGYFGLMTQCGLGSASLQPDNSLVFNLNLTGQLKGHEYGSITATGSPMWTCASNEVIIGFKGIATPTSIDELSPICAALMVKNKL